MIIQGTGSKEGGAARTVMARQEIIDYMYVCGNGPGACVSEARQTSAERRTAKRDAPGVRPRVISKSDPLR